MATRDVVSTRFRIALSHRLKTRFGKMLSAQRFSDLYNLNAHGSSTISRETARLWIRGNAMPDYGHLAVLVQWLELDPEEFLGNENWATDTIKDENRKLNAEHWNHVTRDLLALWDELDPETRRTILVVAQALSTQKAKLKVSASGMLDMQAIISSQVKLPNEDWQI
jgi:hypothetical protein